MAKRRQAYREKHRDTVVDYIYFSELERLRSFETFPHKDKMETKLMALTGLFYLGCGTSTDCYFCDLNIPSWEPDCNRIIYQHYRFSPSCPLLNRQPTNNIAIDQEELDYELDCFEETYNLKKNGQKIKYQYNWFKRPKHRFDSFDQCTDEVLIFLKAKLVEAGLFFINYYEDVVYCFCCGIGLKNWLKSDDPWVQHAMYSPNCTFLKSSKGADFIESCCRIMRTSTLGDNQNDTAVPVEYGETKLCKICYQVPCNMALVPCGHVVACDRCAVKFDNCPVCRQQIRSIVRLYYS